jgi:hypothetical protein
MSIDRIGKAGPAAPLPAPPAESSPATRPFSVGESNGVAPVKAASVAPSTALESLRSGAIDLGQYLDLKVSEATAHLSFLPPADLSTIQGALRERLASDPTLVDLVQTAGQAAGQGARSSDR